jgi:hypothetical protein
LVINRTAQGTTLYMRGRDVEERESAITFDSATCQWSILGNAAEVQRSDGRRVILAAMAETPDATMTPQEIADAAGLPGVTVRSLLHRMMRDGEIRKAGRGKYGVGA